MAYTKIALTNNIELKTAPVGYSWTVLFFGPFPPLIRGDWGWSIGILVGNLLSYGIAGLVCSFFYNKTYIKGLFNKGYYVHAMPPDMNEEKLKNYLGFITLPGSNK